MTKSNKTVQNRNHRNRVRPKTTTTTSYSLPTPKGQHKIPPTRSQHQKDKTKFPLLAPNTKRTRQQPPTRSQHQKDKTKLANNNYINIYLYQVKTTVSNKVLEFLKTGGGRIERERKKNKEIVKQRKKFLLSK